MYWQISLKEGLTVFHPLLGLQEVDHLRIFIRHHVGLLADDETLFFLDYISYIYLEFT